MDSDPNNSPLADSPGSQDPRLPAVSAVVVNHNGGAGLGVCLDALKSQVCPLQKILVVDSGSSDGSPERVRADFPDIEVFELGANLGPSVSRNTGLERLETGLVLSVDSDIYLEPDCLQKMLRAYQQHQPTMICPRVVLYPQRDQVHCDGGAFHFVGTLALENGFRPIAQCPPGPSGPVGAAISACLLIEREPALAAGGFDEMYFFYFEDLEFSLKLRIRGHSIFCVPEAIALHDRGQGTPGLAFRGQGSYPSRRAYFSMRNRWLTVLAYLHWRTILVLSPALVSYEVATMSLALVRGWFFAWIRAWWWLWTHPGRIQIRRRRAQNSRVVEDTDLLAGGPIPLAPGLLHSPFSQALVRMFSASLNSYWRMVRRWIH